MEKRLLKQPNSMPTKVMNNNEKGSWKDTTNNILNRNTNDTQTPTPNGIVKRFQETIKQKAEGKTKTYLKTYLITPSGRPGNANPT